MKKILLLNCIALTTVLTLPVHSAREDTTQLQADAAQIIRQFAGTLKPRLKAAMQNGGPVTAIKVCSEQAPEIARQLSEETGWEVKRVSLKPRNSKTAVADQWEEIQLKQFEVQQKNGVPVSKLIYSETQDNRFRFVKAQPVEGLCLNCHGHALSKDIKKTLQQFYPNDKATGYSIGQIRGAFSLSKEL